MVKQKIKSKLTNVYSISYTIDYWSSNSNKCLLTLASHFLDENFTLNNILLETR